MFSEVDESVVLCQDSPKIPCGQYVQAIGGNCDNDKYARLWCPESCNLCKESGLWSVTIYSLHSINIWISLDEFLGNLRLLDTMNIISIFCRSVLWISELLSNNWNYMVWFWQWITYDWTIWKIVLKYEYSMQISWNDHVFLYF